MPAQKKPSSPKREALLQAAMQVFSESGYQGATMDEIARRAGVAKGTSYLHFSDKADLFYAVFESWMAEMMAATEQALVQAETASERLMAMALSAVDVMEVHREWFPLTLEVWSASTTPALRERFSDILQRMYAGYRAEIAALIRAGQQAGELRVEADAEALAALLTGAIDGLFLQCWFDPALEARKAVRGFFDALFKGIAVHAQGDR